MIFAQGQQKSIPDQICVVFSQFEAYSLFGPVIYEKDVNTMCLKLLLKGCEEYIMVNVFDGMLVIVNEKKEVLSESIVNLKVDDKFYVFSIEKVIELLSKGKSSFVVFQIRKEVFSISNGSFVLEMAEICPPICP
jgi:hypothetical protein